MLLSIDEITTTRIKFIIYIKRDSVYYQCIKTKCFKNMLAVEFLHPLFDVLYAHAKHFLVYLIGSSPYAVCQENNCRLTSDYHYRLLKMHVNGWILIG